MSKKPDGGPAFPAPGYIQQGMTLRDAIAMSAPECPYHADFPFLTIPTPHRVVDDPDKPGGKLVLHSRQETQFERMARWAYGYADAMLAERDK